MPEKKSNYEPRKPNINPTNEEKGRNKIENKKENAIGNMMNLNYFTNKKEIQKEEIFQASENKNIANNDTKDNNPKKAEMIETNKNNLKYVIYQNYILIIKIINNKFFFVLPTHIIKI